MLLLAVLAVLAAACGSSWPMAEPGGAPALAGVWNGWVAIGRLGNGPASMTLAADGRFTGVVRLADDERPFHGAITRTGAQAMRYDASFGDGTAAVRDESGRATLKLVPDGGGGGATFVKAAD